MGWFTLAVLATIFYASTTYIDQYLSRKYFMGRPYSHVVFGGISNFMFLPIIYIAFPDVIAIPASHALTIIGVGLVFSISAIPYFLGLQKGDAAAAMPALQILPFFTLILGWLFLGEVLNWVQMLAGAVIIAGAILMQWDFKAKKFSRIVLFYILICAAIISVHLVLLREIAQDTPWYMIAFWFAFGYCLFGTIITAISRQARYTVYKTLVQSKGRALAIDFIQEILAMIGICLTTVAMTSAPTATHVTLTLGLQPVALLLLSLILGRFIPEWVEANTLDRVFIYRLIGAIVILMGLYGLIL